MTKKHATTTTRTDTRWTKVTQSYDGSFTVARGYKGELVADNKTTGFPSKRAANAEAKIWLAA